MVCRTKWGSCCCGTTMKSRSMSTASLVYKESQNRQLAQQVVSVRPILELRNFWLVPSDIDALAFVVNSAVDNAVGLDFGACSMELECLDALSRCQYIHHLR
ncbi:hypothetical protein XENOCAPTIV_012904 [Xenoophorus captivus]|uniref:Uncharacterized protein n=1 Tax=Xenoophorus captivus TaxID=1517983 RepID=A0ABV0RHA7_9TELE